MTAGADDTPVLRVLFVCMGNICRSPTAEAVFRALVDREGLADRIEVDSAGTYDYHVGERADRRAREAAGARGFDLAPHRARVVTKRDFHHYDYVLAMDVDNYEDLIAKSPDGFRERVALFLSFAPEVGVDEVPDPYYGGTRGFDHVLDLCERASVGLLADVRRRLSASTA